MKKKDMINLVANAIKDNVPYIAVKQTNPALKAPAVNILPNICFQGFLDGLVGYNDDLEFNFYGQKVKFVDACILKELPFEIKLFLKI